MKSEIVDINEIYDVIIAYANGDFSKRLDPSENADARDSIVVGINMLGEELEQKTISRNYFSNIYNAVSDMLIVTDRNGFVQDVNEITINTIKLAKEAFINLDVKTIFDDIKNEIEEVLLGYIDKVDFETTILNSFDETVSVNCSISKINNQNNEHLGYLFIAKDITEKKNQEKALLNIMIATEEKERKRLAYDIHDSLGQELNAIQMFLSTLNYTSPNDKRYKDILEECKTILNQSINTARNLSFDLMPKALEEGYLSSAIEGLIDKLRPLCSFTTHIRLKSELTKDKQIIIYRVFQEFINNSLKYTSPCIINIDIKETKGKIKFLIEDFGNGFDTGNCKKGNGIHNITTRLKAINADFDYTSQIGIGTKLQFSIAL